MKTVRVVLNGQEHQVNELRSRQNAGWRQLLEAHFEELARALEHAPDTDLTDGQAVARLVQTFAGKLLRSVDIVRELLTGYAPDLERVMDEAYDSEIIDAFIAVLGLAYPFGFSRLAGMLDQFSPANPGPHSRATTPS